MIKNVTQELSNKIAIISADETLTYAEKYELIDEVLCAQTTSPK